MTTFTLPVRGSRLLPAVLDQSGTETPGRIYVSFPRTHDIVDGFRDVTHGEVLHAVDALADWLSKSFGISKDFETLAYTGIADLRYIVFFHAAVKCGYKVLLPSSRNPANQNVLLLEQTRSNKLFYSPELVSVVKEIQQMMGTDRLRIFEITPFDRWLEAYQTPFPFTKSFEEARFDPILVLHSSGSTGAPKPIVQTHQYFANDDRPLPKVPHRQTAGNELFDWDGDGYFFSPFPPSHLAGFTSFMCHPLLTRNASLLLGFPDRPPMPEVVLQMMMRKKVRLLYSPPSIIEALLSLPGAVDMIKKLDDIVYAGGPLEKTAGDKLSKLTRVSPIYGATETACIAVLVQPPETWQYMEFHPAWKVTMEPALDGAYELVLKKDDEADQYRGIGGTILREKPEYRTRDLFLPHPDRPELWRFYSRNDDIIVFSNGQKWNPIPSENVIRAHPDVSGVLIIGDGRFQPAAIIEPKPSVTSPDDLLEALWPLVEQANQQAQGFGRLMRSKIAIVQPGDFARAPKGTIIRATTAKNLSSVIEGLYADVVDSATLNGNASRKNKKQSLSEMADPQSRILQIVKESTQKSERLAAANNNDDLFHFGLDSLKALEVTQSIKTELAAYFDESKLSFITTLMLFKYPTISQLAETISNRLSEDLEEDRSRTHQHDIERMIETYTSKTNFPQVVAPLAEGSQLHIVLIGSTGFLGQHLLTTLIQRPDIVKITCINRNPSAQKMHSQQLQSIKTKAQVEFHTMSLTDISIEELQRHKELFENTDGVIFSAWTVNFNQPLWFFEPQIRALSALCTVLISLENSPRLFFISSISSSIDSQTVVPEMVLHNASGSMPMGYAQSKYVAERVLSKFTDLTPLDVTILRLGQIAGPVSDSIGDLTVNANIAKWNEAEWFPSVMKTSAKLGLIPSELDGPVDWIPVNLFTRGISELISHDILGKRKLQVYNLVNPSPVSWSDLVPVVQEAMPKSKIVPFATWLKDLKAKASELKEAEKEKYPALRIIDYLESRVDASEVGKNSIISVDKAKTASPTIANLQSVDKKWVKQWLAEWDLNTSL